MDNLVLRTSEFIRLVKNAANEWADSKAMPLPSLEDMIKLFPTGNYLKPVHVYIPGEPVLSASDMGLLPVYEAAACEFYNTLQQRYNVVPDSAPAHAKSTPLPEYGALIEVIKKTRGWIEDYRIIRQFRYLIQVLPVDSKNQIGIFVPYETLLPEESRKEFRDLRIRAQRVYAEILRRKGVPVELPVVSIAAATDRLYMRKSDGKSATIN